MYTRAQPLSSPPAPLLVFVPPLRFVATRHVVNRAGFVASVSFHSDLPILAVVFPRQLDSLFSSSSSSFFFSFLRVGFSRESRRGEKKSADTCYSMIHDRAFTICEATYDEIGTVRSRVGSSTIGNVFGQFGFLSTERRGRYWSG